MMSDQLLQLAPPWGSKFAWQEVHANIGYHIHRYQTDLKPVATIARQARILLDSIYTLLDDLGTETCDRCAAPCCLTSSPWFDFRDLIFLHLNHLAIPLTQSIDAYKTACCYLSSGGCTLSRAIRPWICTWYLCPVQTSNLKKRRLDQYETFVHTVREIKCCRRQMEDAFIRIII